MTRLLLDQGLPRSAVRHLEERGSDPDKGFEAQHVTDPGIETARDAEIWSFAQGTDAEILTQDERFASIAMANANGPRVAWGRVDTSTIRSLLAWLEPAWPALVAPPDAAV